MSQSMSTEPAEASSSSVTVPRKPSPVSAFDADSPLFVAKSVVAWGALGAATGGTLGVIRNQSPVVLSVNMGINLTVASLAFYSTREYIVSPLLLSSGATASHVRRMEALSEKQRGKLPESVAGPGSYGQIRVERVLDSGLAGALNAGTLSGLFRGPRTIVPAAFTAGLITTALQFGANEARVIRLKLLARRQAQLDPASQPTSFSQEGAAADGHLVDAAEPVTPPQKAAKKPLQERIMSGLSAITPIHKITDQEYLASLQNQQAEVERKLKMILREEEWLFNASAARQAGEKTTSEHIV